MIKGFPKGLSPHHWNYSLLERIESNEPIVIPVILPLVLKGPAIVSNLSKCLSIFIDYSERLIVEFTSLRFNFNDEILKAS